MEMRDPAHHVSPRAVVFWTVRALPGWLLLLAGQLLWFVASGDHAVPRFSALSVTAPIAATHLPVLHHGA